jgi:hypothetical protein
MWPASRHDGVPRLNSVPSLLVAIAFPLKCRLSGARARDRPVSRLPNLPSRGLSTLRVNLSYAFCNRASVTLGRALALSFSPSVRIDFP